MGFLRRLAMHDHVVALNSPRLIPSGVHRKTERDMVVSMSSTALVNSGGNSYSMRYGLGLSGSALRPRVRSMEFDASASATDSLEPHWLPEPCIQVFHTYDYRYQDGYSRQRVAAIYLPLVHHMAAKVSRLDKINRRGPERGGLLVTLLYVLQDAPEALLPEMWKDVYSPFSSHGGGTARPKRAGRIGGSVGVGEPAAGSGFRMGGGWV